VIFLSCTLFQNYGKEILLSQSNKTGIGVSKQQLKRLESIICEIYTRNIVDQPFITNLSNELQHEDRSIKYSSNQAK
jgi:hypothetical protein